MPGTDVLAQLLKNPPPAAMIAVTDRPKPVTPATTAAPQKKERRYRTALMKRILEHAKTQDLMLADIINPIIRYLKQPPVDFDQIDSTWHEKNQAICTTLDKLLNIFLRLTLQELEKCLNDKANWPNDFLQLAWHLKVASTEIALDDKCLATTHFTLCTQAETPVDQAETPEDQATSLGSSIGPSTPKRTTIPFGFFALPKASGDTPSHAYKKCQLGTTPPVRPKAPEPTRKWWLEPMTQEGQAEKARQQKFATAVRTKHNLPTPAVPPAL